MITLNASGGSVTFTFSGNSTYLNDGVITCPINSLALIIDESDMVTFKKSQSSDIFVSANIAEFGMTKAELEAWYKANMVGSSGGGGGVTPSQVQTMIDESISGKAESSAVTEEITAAVSGKADSSAVTEEISVAVSGKQDTLSAGRGISISSDTVSVSLPISAGTGVNSVKIGNPSNVASALFSYAEGSITTASSQSSHAEGDQTLAYGEAAHAEGIATSAAAYSHAEGFQTLANGETAHAEGYKTSATSVYSHAEGYRTITNNECEHASGQYNVSSSGSSDFGDSGNTLFSVGNGANNNSRHNAFEVRQNGDIYLSSGGTDIKLQDHLGGGGSITIDPTLDSGSTNPVANSAITNALIIDDYYSGTTATYNGYFPSENNHVPYNEGFASVTLSGTAAVGGMSRWTACIGVTKSDGTYYSPGVNVYAYSENEFLEGTICYVYADQSLYQHSVVNPTNREVIGDKWVATLTCDDGYRITYIKKFYYSDGEETLEPITFVNQTKIYDGGQAKYVIENVIEPELIRLSTTGGGGGSGSSETFTAEDRDSIVSVIDANCNTVEANSVYSVSFKMAQYDYIGGTVTISGTSYTFSGQTSFSGTAISNNYITISSSLSGNNRSFAITSVNRDSTPIDAIMLRGVNIENMPQNSRKLKDIRIVHNPSVGDNKIEYLGSLSVNYSTLFAPSTFVSSVNDYAANQNLPYTSKCVHDNFALKSALKDYYTSKYMDTQFNSDGNTTKRFKDAHFEWFSDSCYVKEGWNLPVTISYSSMGETPTSSTFSFNPSTGSIVEGTVPSGVGFSADTSANTFDVWTTDYDTDLTQITINNDSGWINMLFPNDSGYRGIFAYRINTNGGPYDAGYNAINAQILSTYLILKVQGQLN